MAAFFILGYVSVFNFYNSDLAVCLPEQEDHADSGEKF